MTTKDYPSTQSYPALQAWLNKHDAMCQWELDHGPLRTRLQLFTLAELKCVAEALTQYTDNFDDSGDTDAETAKLNPHLADAERMRCEVESEWIRRVGG